MKFSKQKMLSSPAVNGQTTSPFLLHTRAKMTTTLCHGHFRLCILQKIFSSVYLCSPTLKARPPTPRATEPPLSLSLPHVQHTHLLPLLRLWFILLHFASCSLHFPLQPHIPPVSATQQGDTPFPLMAAPAAHRAAPVQLSHP